MKSSLLLSELNIFILAHKEIWLKRQGPNYEFGLNMGKNSVSGLHQRPKEIDSRKLFGHWKGILLNSKETKSQVITIFVERESRMVLLIKNNSKHSKGVMEMIHMKLQGLKNDCHSWS